MHIELPVYPSKKADPVFEISLCMNHVLCCFNNSLFSPLEHFKREYSRVFDTSNFNKFIETA